MKARNYLDIRRLYIDFFQSRGHKVYDSMPLVSDDASLLFTNAGMVQFKDIFTGKIPTPMPPTATSSQLCIRAGGKHNDLENVGYTARHHTLFEMLGNFSFGDYFKKEAIAHAWEFVTNILGFDKSVLYVTIHESDDEAYDLWCKHIDPSRIKRMGDKDNFWQMGDTGPCGPCSEIYVDQGSEFFHSEEDYFGGEGDRFLEIWNLVFMQYEQKDGARTPLPKPSIDTGMGLERVMALKEGRINNFDSSLFQSIMKRIEEITGLVYVRDDELLKKHLACDDGNSSLGNHLHNPSDPASLRRMSNTPHLKGFSVAQSNTANTRIDKKEQEASKIKSTESIMSEIEGKDLANITKETTHKIKAIQASFRVIADHARSVAFLLAQGVNFDKEGRGYVLRRILRRAVRHGYLLGLRKAFLYEVVGAVCESMGGHYGYLLERKNAIQEQCRAEEERFFETIELGMDLFNTELEKLGHSALSEKSGSASLDNPQSKALAEASLETSGTILECEDSKQAESKAKNTKSKNAQQLTQSAKAVENHKAAVSLVNTRIVGSEIQDFKTDLEFSPSDSNTQKHPHNAQDSKVFTSQAKSLESQGAQKHPHKSQDFKIFDEKSAFSSESARSYLSGSDEARACRIADLSQKAKSYTFSGEVAFKLYDTYGFPLDLTQDMLREYGIELDMAGFEACMQEQKIRGKASWKGSGDALKNGDFNALVSEFGANNFVGYECVEAQSRVLALLDSNFNRIDSLSSGEEGWVMLEATPFYPESGGPVGDKGALLANRHSALSDKSAILRSDFRLRTSSARPQSSLESPNFSSQILECQDSKVEDSNTQDSQTISESISTHTAAVSLRNFGGAQARNEGVTSSVMSEIEGEESAKITKETTQIAKVLDTQKFFTLNLSQIMACQPIKVGDTIMASVDFKARNEISKHHSATHLLHYALRQILGKHIAQAGSLVESHRLRFDFSHNKPIQLEELEQIEALVNEKIIENSTQICEFMDMDSAKKKGAMALFSEKYGEQVRVISFGDSIELCGGIHVKNTAEIGSFYIVKESGVSSGVRRIEAVCGSAAYNYGKSALDSIHRVKEELKAQDIHAAITRLKSQLAEAKQKTSKSAYSLAFEEVGGVRLIVLDLGECEASEAKELVDRAKNEAQKVAVLLLTQKGEKVAITAGVKGIAGLKASTWVKEVAKSLGGNGGGRDDFASAGGKITESNSLSQALELAKALALKVIG